MSKTMTISARSKGFPLRLSRQHYYVVYQMYPWLQSIGATDALMDEALTLLPQQKLTAAEVKGLQNGVEPSFMSYQSGFYKSKTIRIRAEHLEGMIRLLKAAAMCCNQGQVGGTLWRRAESLESVSALDKLADASR